MLLREIVRCLLEGVEIVLDAADSILLMDTSFGDERLILLRDEIRRMSGFGESEGLSHRPVGKSPVDRVRECALICLGTANE